MENTEANTTQQGPSPLSEEMGQLRVLADQHAMEDEKKRARRAAEKADQKVKEAADLLWMARGTRFRGCSLENYEVSTPQQAEVVSNLRQYAKGLNRYLGGGMGLVLIGPVGTGKDHLMAALFHLAIALGKTIKWTSGLRLFRESRDAIDSDYSEASALKKYTKSDVFAISDPSWQRTPLTRYQREVLGEIVDERWNNARPTWATVNAAGRDDAERLLGDALVDRLADGALSLPCDWKSYRKSITKLKAAEAGGE